jgi:hypothetical protein
VGLEADEGGGWSWGASADIDSRVVRRPPESRKLNKERWPLHSNRSFVGDKVQVVKVLGEVVSLPLRLPTIVRCIELE